MTRNLTPLTGLLLVGLLLSGCVTSSDAATAEARAVELDWRHAGQPQAVVVMVHGFNLNPRRMDEMAALLQAGNMDVLQVSLAGHRMSLSPENRRDEFAAMEGFPVWQANMDQAMSEASSRAASLDLPLYLMGFSMGGLLGADHLNRHESSRADRAVLLAPALSLRWTSWLLRPLGALPDFLLPSLGADQYKANEFVPVSAYEALYDGVAQLNEQTRPERLNIPTLVLVSRADELVSGEGLEAFIAEHRLDQWALHYVDNSDGDEEVLQHVIVDRNTLGETAWESVTKRILSFLHSPGD
ncbi:MAG: alpha/beta fold hydrolase [Pseudohongiellaceae bacterium]